MRKGRAIAGAVLLWLLVASAALAQDPSVPVASPMAEASTIGETVWELPFYAGFYVYGDGLYYWARRDGLQTAILPTGSAETLSWSGTPGFRLGLGLRVPETCWDFVASFTYFHDRSQLTVTAPPGGSLQPVFTANPVVHDVTIADGDCGLTFGVVDLDVGRSLSIAEPISVRLFAGVRAALVDQSPKCIYSGGALGGASDFVNDRINFDGAGLTMGAEANWDIWRGWGVIAKARLGLIAGRFDVSRSETFGTAAVSNISEPYDAVVPLAEVSLGLGYQGERFFFSAGWEFANWFNLCNGLAAPAVGADQTARRQGNLTLEAVSARVGFSF